MAVSPLQVGERIPSVRLRRLEKGVIVDYLTTDLAAGKNILVVGFPGAFTPVCDGTHLPSFVENAAHIKSQGIDLIIGVAVNDPWVMYLWGLKHGVGDKVMMLSDGNGDFARASGMAFSAQELGVGERMNRCFMIFKNGMATKVNYERGMSVSCTLASDAINALDTMG